MFQDKATIIAQKLTRFNQGAEERDAQRRAARDGKPYLNLITAPVEIDALQIIPEEKAKKMKIAAINLINKNLVVAVFDLKAEGLEGEFLELRKMGYDLDFFIVSLSGLKHAWSYYVYVAREGGEITRRFFVSKEKIEEFKKNVLTIKSLRERIKNIDFNHTEVSEFLSIIAAGALTLKASDIHFEPVREGVGIRLRLDGVLNEVIGGRGEALIEKEFYNQVASRIKLFSGLKLNITDETQDGRFTINLGGEEVETRVAIAPAEFGEVMVMRILDPAAISLKLSDLGFSENDLKIIKGQLSKPNGMILNTGPTGSGKTTTLYAFLREVVSTEIKIITIEDPIEYHLEGLEQTQVNPEANYTFAGGLRSILRQDPDVVLVGEIRDEDTAAIAVNASLTGHLVFSTLHTNDAAGAVPRLLDLKVKTGVIGSALNLVIAQRLVRKLCQFCKKEAQVSHELEEKIKKVVASLPEKIEREKYVEMKIFEPSEKTKDCEKCNGTGYKGRLGIFELFVIDDKVQRMIEGKNSILDIKQMAREQGMITMQEDGVLKVLKGITSLEEIERATGVLQI